MSGRGIKNKDQARDAIANRSTIDPRDLNPVISPTTPPTGREGTKRPSSASKRKRSPRVIQTTPVTPLSQSKDGNIGNKTTPRSTKPPTVLVPSPQPTLRRSSRKSIEPRDWWANPFATERRRLEHTQRGSSISKRSQKTSKKRDIKHFRSNDDTSHSQSPPLTPVNISQHASIAATFSDEEELEETPPRQLRRINEADRVPPPAPRKSISLRSRIERYHISAIGQTAIGSEDDSTPGELIVSRSNLSQLRSVNFHGLVDEHTPSRCGFAVAQSSNLQFHSVPTSNGHVEVATAICANSSFIGELRIPGRTCTGRRQADNGDEIFFLLSGILQCDVNFTRVSLHEGGYIAVPHTSNYAFSNQFGVSCRLLFFAPRNPFA